MQQNPDVAQAVADGVFTAAQHFTLFGQAEGRAPGPLFDPQHYLSANPDVAQAVQSGLINAYEHFMMCGAAEGRPPIAAFDAVFYLNQNEDVNAAVLAGEMTAVEHFLQFGQYEPRNIILGIDLAAYLRQNSDLNAAYQAGLLSPLDHLLNYGLTEGRNLGNGVDLKLFQNDPTFLAAIANGDFDGALERISEVAPFLPGFQRPPGWVPAPNTPIPLDFVPPAGMMLVVPPEVVVPDSVILPDTFVPTGTPPLEPPEGPPEGPPDGPPDEPPEEEPEPVEIVVNFAQTFTAAQLDDKVVIGLGAVTVNGSAGNQRLEIGTDGPNQIAGGQGSDTIILNSAGTDTLIIGGGQAPVKEVHRFDLDAGYLQAGGYYKVTLWNGAGETIQVGPLSGDPVADLVAKLNESDSLVSFKRVSDTSVEVAYRIRHGDVLQQASISKTDAEGNNASDTITSTTSVNHDPGVISDSAFWYLDPPANTQPALDIVVGFNANNDKLQLPYGSAAHGDSGTITPDTPGFEHNGLIVASITNGIATFSGRAEATAADKTRLLLDVLKDSTDAKAFIDENALGQDSTFIVQGDGMQGDTIADVYLVLANTVITDLGGILVGGT